MNKLRGLVRATWLLALFFAGFVCVLARDVVHWFCVPAKRSGEGIITPLEDYQVPEYIQPIVAAWRQVAEWFGYKGPVVWYFRGGVTREDVFAEYGHARILNKIFDWWVERGPLFVFWVPCLQKVTGDLHANASEQRVFMNALHQDHFSMPPSHVLSFGDSLTLYLLLLHHKRMAGQYFLPQNEARGSWLIRTNSFYQYNDERIHIYLGGWGGIALDFNGDAEADKGLTRFFALGVESASNFTLKRAA